MFVAGRRSRFVLCGMNENMKFRSVNSAEMLVKFLFHCDSNYVHYMYYYYIFYGINFCLFIQIHVPILSCYEYGLKVT